MENKATYQCRLCKEPYNAWNTFSDDGICSECHEKADAKDRKRV